MRRIALLLTALALFLGGSALDGRAQGAKKGKKETVEALMKKKLAQSQKVLEGIALYDFEKIEKGAKELLGIWPTLAKRELIEPKVEIAVERI